MKRVCLLFALTLCFSLFSCGKTEGFKVVEVNSSNPFDLDDIEEPVFAKIDGTFSYHHSEDGKYHPCIVTYEYGCVINEIEFSPLFGSFVESRFSWGHRITVEGFYVPMKLLTGGWGGKVFFAHVEKRALGSPGGEVK